MGALSDLLGKRVDTTPALRTDKSALETLLIPEVFQPEEESEAAPIPVPDIETPPLDWWDKVKQIGSNPTQLVPFLASGVEVVQLADLLLAAKRLKDGRETDKDLKKLQEYIEKQDQDKSFGYKVLDVVSMLPSFAGELFLTAGVATAGRLLTVKGAKEGLKYVMTKGGRELLEKRLAEKGLARRLAAGLAGRTLQAPVAGATRIAAGTVEKQLRSTLSVEDIEDKENLGRSLAKAFGEQWVETVSEFSGGILKFAARPIKNKFVKVSLFSAFKKANPGKRVSTLQSIVDKTGYNGVIGEMFEERLGEVGHGVLAELGLSDQEFKVPTGEQLAIELVAFSVPGVGIAVLNKVVEGPNGMSIDKEPPVETLEFTTEPKAPAAPAAPTGVAPTIPLEKLQAEARKFKTAEEFVGSQQKLFFGGKTLDTNIVTEKGLSLSSDRSVARMFANARTGRPDIQEFFLPKNAKIINVDEIPIDLISGKGGGLEGKFTRAAQWAKNNGFDAVRFTGEEAEIRVVNPDILKTKSQLTDLFNQTKEAPKAAPEAKPEEAEPAEPTKPRNFLERAITKAEEFKSSAEFVRELKPSEKRAIARQFDLPFNTTSATGLKKAYSDFYTLVAKRELTIREGTFEERVAVGREQLPVGVVAGFPRRKGLEPKERASRLEARIEGQFKNVKGEQIEELGLTAFEAMNKPDQIRKATAYVRRSPDNALEVLQGTRPEPKGILRNSIFVAMYNEAKGNVELAVKLASLASTRAGQEISILTELDANSPVRYIKQLTDRKVESSGGKEKVRELVKKDVADAKEEVREATPTKFEWQAFISEITC